MPPDADDDEEEQVSRLKKSRGMQIDVCGSDRCPGEGGSNARR